MTYNYPEVVASRERHAAWFKAQGPALPQALRILQGAIDTFADTPTGHEAPGCRVLSNAYRHIANPAQEVK